MARVAFIQQRFGESGYESVLARLAPEHREKLAGLLMPQAWLPIELMIELIESADRVLGRGDGALCRAMARYSADANLTTLYKLFFRISSASYVLSKASMLWNVHYDSGRLELEKTGPKHMRLSIVGFDTPSCTHCTSVFTWAERSIELSGGKHVAASVEGCRKRGAAACHCRLTFT